MTFLTSHSPTATGEGSILARMAALAGSLFAALAEARRIHRNARELESLSDEALKDIGVERSQIARVARYGRIIR